MALGKLIEFPIVKSGQVRVVRLLRRRLEALLDPRRRLLSADNSVTGTLRQIMGAQPEADTQKDAANFQDGTVASAYCLHNLIHDERVAGDAARDLQAVEKLIDDSMDMMLTAEEIGELRKDYKNAVEAAEKAVLKNANVVLATTTQATSKRFRGISAVEGKQDNLQDNERARVPPYLHFSAVVVDEASMLTEADLLATVACGVHRVALVGDHKQLQPVVVSQSASHAGVDPRAKNLGNKPNGLARSLFERHFGPLQRARLGHTVMLRQQYRMHDDICKVGVGREMNRGAR